MKLRIGILLLSVLLLPVNTRADHSVLHTAATNLTAGSWVEITNIANINTVLTGTGGASGFIFGFTDKWVWDHVGHAGYFLGSDHNACPRFVKYDEATNSMVRLTDVPWHASSGCAGNPALHGYHHNAIDWLGRKLYHRPYNSHTVQSYDLTSGTWTALPTIATGSGASQLEYTNITAGVDFMPWLGSHGWLVMHEYEGNVNGTLIRWDPNAATWDTPTGWEQTIPMVGNYHQVAECAIVSRTCLLGGGNSGTAVRLITPRETFTTATSAPLAYGINTSITTHDPVTGKFLFLWASNSWYEYDSITNVWTSLTGTASVLSAPNAGTPAAHGVVATPLYDYGVVFFLKCGSSSSCSGWLYKHATSNEATRNFYANRCLQPGVILCQGFDTSNDFTGSTRASVARVDTAGDATPARDTTVSASGLSSMKMTVPANSGSNSSGSWNDNFRDNMTRQIDQNSDVYYSFRVRYSCEFLFVNCPAATSPRSYQLLSGSGGYKLAIFGTGDTAGTPAFSCTAMEVVIQNSFQRHFPQMYNSCVGSASHSSFDPFEQSFASQFSGSDFKLQNARPSPFCLYSQLPNVNVGNNCFPFYANEWLSFKVHITTGTRTNGEFVNSHVDMYVARDGDTSWTQLFNWGPYNLTAPVGQNFGKIWLLPYHTGKDPAQTNPVGFVWYDELIVSTQDIAVPGQVGVQSSTAINARGLGRIVISGGARF